MRIMGDHQISHNIANKKKLTKLLTSYLSILIWTVCANPINVKRLFRTPINQLFNLHELDVTNIVTLFWINSRYHSNIGFKRKKKHEKTYQISEMIWPLIRFKKKKSFQKICVQNSLTYGERSYSMWCHQAVQVSTSISAVVPWTRKAKRDIL